MDNILQIENKEIEQIFDIFNLISDNIEYGRFMVLSEKGAFCILGDHLKSVSNTLITIDGCIRNCFYADAFTLTRKIRDDLMQSLFLLDIVINGYEVDKAIETFDINDVETFLNLILQELENRLSGEKRMKNQDVLESWFFDDLDNDENYSMRKRYFDASKYKNFLEGHEQIDYMISNFLQSDWKQLDRYLNNYVHANGRKYIIQNYYSYETGQENKEIVIKLLQKIAVIFMSILFMLDSTLFRSHDYIWALDTGETPIEGSQYWVASGITEFMKKYCSKNLLQYLQDFNPYEMRIIEEN